MSRKKLLFLFSIFLFLVFIYFSYLVHKGVFKQTDFDTTVRLQNHISRRFDLPFSVISLLGSAEVTGLIWLGMAIFFLFKKYYLTFLASFLFWAGVAAELYGKIFVYHPAPPYLFYRGAISFNFPSSYVQESYSYPSGHATRLTFLISILLSYIYLTKFKTHKLLVQIILIGFLIAVYVSRIYLGEHWLSDVVGGALLGGSLGIFTAITIPQSPKPSQKTDSLVESNI